MESKNSDHGICYPCGPTGTPIGYQIISTNKLILRRYLLRIKLEQVEGVGINKKLNNSINFHSTHYTTGVHSKSDWVDWYNVPDNLIIYWVCIPGCSKGLVTSR